MFVKMWFDLKDYILDRSDSVNLKYLIGVTLAGFLEIIQNKYFILFIILLFENWDLNKIN